MARTAVEVRIVPSLLDRLIDHEPEQKREPPPSRSATMRLMKEAVRRDLAWLLNTRQNADELPPGLAEAEKSLPLYGLPDFTTVNVKSPTDQNRLRRALENAITAFEPRLMDVSVSVEPEAGHERAVHFRIDARLRVDPAPEPVTFDTTLQLASGQYNVQGD